MSVLAQQPETGTGSSGVDLARRLVAEALGTGLLIVAVIGSGIMASRLSPDDVGLQLLENAAATAAALIGLILIFGAVSGAHFNPAVTLVDRAFGDITSRDAGLYVVAQVVGGCLGAVVANLMFELAAIELSTKAALVGRVVAVGGRRDGRAAARHPRLCPHRTGGCRGLRRRVVDRRCLLVHVLDQLRQPGRHDRPHLVGQLRRHRTGLGADVHRHAADRRGDRLRVDPFPVPADR